MVFYGSLTQCCRLPEVRWVTLERQEGRNGQNELEHQDEDRAARRHLVLSVLQIVSMLILIVKMLQLTAHDNHFILLVDGLEPRQLPEESLLLIWWLFVHIEYLFLFLTHTLLLLQFARHFLELFLFQLLKVFEGLVEVLVAEVEHLVTLCVLVVVLFVEVFGHHGFEELVDGANATEYDVLAFLAIVIEKVEFVLGKGPEVAGNF